MDLNKRKIPHYSDDLHFFKGRLYKVGEINDDRLQIRIVPHMLGIDEKEQDNLPKFPPLVKGQVLKGFTEVDDGVDKASLVYVIATPDFQYGFVLCLANQFESISTQKMSDSIAFSKVTNFLSARGVSDKKFPYKDTVVEKFVMSDDGGIVDLYNFRTGESIKLLSTGTLLAVLDNTIIMRVGSPGKSPAEKVPFSEIRMDPTAIIMQSHKIHLSAKAVLLGKKMKGHTVLGTIAVSPGTGHNGFNLTPLRSPDGSGIFA